METAIKKAAVLLEALPYIQSFQKKIVVVKTGGSTMGEGFLECVLRDIVFMDCVGMCPVLVHGGKQAINDEMSRAGLKSQFVQGMRVTDNQAINLVEKALMKVVNTKLVSIINQFGGKARGMSGKAEKIIWARKHLVAATGGEPVDIGFVGDVERVDPQPIQTVIADGAIPVIAPLAVGIEGEEIYNVNADVAAGTIASALRAEKLLFLTDTRGIMERPGDESTVISHLDEQKLRQYVAGGIITGGMIPKANAGIRAIEAGVKKIHIIDGRIMHSLLLEIFTDKGIGTEIVK